MESQDPQIVTCMGPLECLMSHGIRTDLSITHSNASQGPMDKQSDGSHRILMGQGLKNWT